MFLYEDMEAVRRYGGIKEVPKYIPENLNSNFELRPYQIQAFENFVTYFEGEDKERPTQVLFHMATGSGKTLIMAGLMLYLYKQGYRNFLFFVNLSNIVEKTKENFNNRSSSKYLFADEIVIDGERVTIREVDGFQDADTDSINICFTTTQGLHMGIWAPKECGMTLDDFDDRKVVLISDEAHHLNVDTRRMSQEEELSYRSWETTVQSIFRKNSNNILLEFTATCDLENPLIKASYERRIICDYALNRFYQDKYSKDILTLRSDKTIMERALQALMLSQYRLKVFQDHRKSIRPVILFKAKTINESKEFMEEFLDTVSSLTGKKLSDIAKNNSNEYMQKAYDYFSANGITFAALAQELRTDFSPEHCVSVNDDKDAAQKQILLNSLEDADNPYRAIFEVKKLDEGWDVLNLFDIVRLYETRQSGGKNISATTISEAQLIGRGARYCPFQLDDEQPKFQRKYDDDITNDMRICEELFYHCQNDHRYVNELHTALKEIGLDQSKIVSKEYILKDDFKTEEIYKTGWVFINERRLKDRKDVYGIPESIRNNPYTYTVMTGTTGTDAIMTGARARDDSQVELKTSRFSVKEIADINYAIVNKVLMKYPIFKFSTLKQYFPNLKSTREFITSGEYLGDIPIEIRTWEDTPSMTTLYDATFNAVGRVADSISSIEERYEGTKEFKSYRVHEVFRNKTRNYTDPHDGGEGISQKDETVPVEWRLDLEAEEWFAYTDNYGTSEEKAFVAFFKERVPELKKSYQKVFLLRNERALHIYSFADGERFEPDYVLFLQKDKPDGYDQLQVFIEPKGTHLLEKDSWKEQFLLQMKEESIPVVKYKEDNAYAIWGVHFFNKDERMKDFADDFAEIIDSSYSTSTGKNVSYDYVSENPQEYMKVAEDIEEYGKND